MAAAATQDTGNSKGSDFNRETVMTIPLADIKVDPSWNCRSENSIVAEGEGGENGSSKSGYSGLKGLITSIKLDGQDTPVDVVKNTTGGKQPWFLIAGFKRYRAITEIAKEEKQAAPVIKAIVKEMSAVAMRLYNLRENTARDDLSGADLAYGIAQLTGINKDLTSVAISSDLNLSQPYVAKLMRINEKVMPKLIANWRDTPGSKVSVAQMYALASIEKDKQEETYQGYLKDKNKSGKGSDWKVNAKKKAENLGVLFGVLEREYNLNVEEALGDFKDCIRLIVKCPDDAGKADTNKIAKAMLDGYKTGVAEPEAEEEEETES